MICELHLAEQQLLGFMAGKKGETLEQLVNGMGLTADEWKDMRHKFDMAYFNDTDIEEMDRIVSAS